MPIASQCPACQARYNIVSEAAGRRVRCRKCGKPFYVPGELRTARPLFTPKMLAELEETGHSVQNDRDAWLRYQAYVSMLPPKPVVKQKSGGLLSRLKKLQ